MQIMFALVLSSCAFCISQFLFNVGNVIAVASSTDIPSKVRACMAVMGMAADGLLKQRAHASLF